MIATHIDGGGEVRKIRIETKRGKPVVDKLGMVQIIGGKFKDLTKISYEVLENEFKLGEK